MRLRFADRFDPGTPPPSGPNQEGGTTGATKRGGPWQQNLDAVRVMQDIDIAGAQALGGYTGEGTNIAIVDSAQGNGTVADILRKWWRNDQAGVDSGHLELQESLAGDLAAPGADVSGHTLYDGNVDFYLGGSSKYDRAMNTLDEAMKEAGPDGVLAFVAPVGTMTQEEALAMVEKLDAYADGGGTVVMGSGVIPPESWNDPVVREAIDQANIIVIDSPKSGPESDPSAVTVSGESIPAGASSAVDLSVPSPNGWNSVTVSQVAGVVALMKEANPSLSAADIERIITDPGTYSTQAATTDGSMVPFFNAREAVEAARNATSSATPVPR